MENIYQVECIEKKNYKKYIFTDEQKQLICQMYADGASTPKIGTMFNVGHKVIAKVLEELGVSRIGVGRRQYKINEHYFDCVDTPNKAYILGFLYADGCNFPKKSTISMSLEEGDREILELIRKEIGVEKELEFIDYSNKHDFGYTYKNQYRLLMFSAHMCRALIKHGMTPSKSLTLTFPKLREDLIHHFIRGIFDGDGCVVNGSKSTNFMATITSTNAFCETLKSVVERYVDVNCHVYDASNHNGITKVFALSGRQQVKSFLDWIYQDADLLLQRKYNRYIQYFYSDETNINDTLTA